jgi:hypothetical protein
MRNLPGRLLHVWGVHPASRFNSRRTCVACQRRAVRVLFHQGTNSSFDPTYGRRRSGFCLGRQISGPADNGSDRLAYAGANLIRDTRVTGNCP